MTPERHLLKPASKNKAQPALLWVRTVTQAWRVTWLLRGMCPCVLYNLRPVFILPQAPRYFRLDLLKTIEWWWGVLP